MIKKFLAKRKAKKRFERNYKIIKESGLFDKKYYYKNYPDIKAVNIDPIKHYLMHGWLEGRNPSNYFKTSYYLKNYADVSQSTMNPLIHYILNGRLENRKTDNIKLFLDNDITIRTKNSKKKSNNKILVFYYYNEHNVLSNHTIEMLKNIQIDFNKIIFVTNIENKESVKKILINVCSDIIFSNICNNSTEGYVKALKEIIFKYYKNNFNIILMDGNCFSVKSDFNSVFKKFEQNEVDCGYFSVEYKDFKSDKFIYFFSKNFVNSYGDKIINMFESEYLFYDALVEFCRQESINCLQMDDQDICFIPDELLIKSLLPKYLISGFCKKYNIKQSDIENYFNDIYIPNITIKLFNKQESILYQNTKNKSKFNMSIAIHIHVFYIEEFINIVDILKPYSSYIHLFITTVDVKKYDDIVQILVKYGFLASINNVYVCENLGRNVLPWLLLKDKLKSYDIVGHFHTKRSSFYQKEWFGDMWNKSIYSDILKDMDQICSLFENNPSLGIIIPDIPYYFKFIMQDKFIDNNAKIMEELWHKMKFDKYIDFEKLDTPIMPYGMMFWYRPKSLDKLVDYNFSDGDLKSIKEPLGIDGTILHAMERMLLYAAWSNGYDFKIMTSKENLYSGFDMKISLGDVIHDKIF